jgi:LysR family transcriptional regulator, glycine cleavage system transcriptional activator
MPALTVFATAAYAGSFSAAADQLNVTQSAVSRQIQMLEGYLGCPLFFRHKKGLQLTAQGQQLLPVVNDALGRIAGACEGLKQQDHVLVLRLPPTFASRWFLPRLSQLRDRMPGIEFRISTFQAWEPEFERSEVDAAVVQGDGQWRGVHAIALMPEQLTPVCSPDLVASLEQPHDVLKHTLLHCFPFNTWEQWLLDQGVHERGILPGQTFDTMELALLAAQNGQGLAIGDVNLIRAAMHTGALVTPFPESVKTGQGYYLVFPPDRLQLPKIRQLSDWMQRLASDR